MKPPFRFLDFQRVAYRLGNGNDEADLRTAVSRLYYALFHCAKDRLGVSGKKFIHKKVVTEVKKRDAATGSQLNALKRLRTSADYEVVPTGRVSGNWKANWRRAQGIATHILPKLQKLKR